MCIAILNTTHTHTHTHTEVTCRKEYCNIEYNTHTQKLHVEKCIAILNTTHTCTHKEVKCRKVYCNIEYNTHTHTHRSYM